MLGIAHCMRLLLHNVSGVCSTLPKRLIYKYTMSNVQHNIGTVKAILHDLYSVSGVLLW